MKRFLGWLKNLFFPPPHSTVVRRIMPYAVVVVLLLVVFVGSMAAWEGTNQTVFCGTTCHTMPPEYTTQQASAHVNITCEDCHLGRAPIFTEIVRKAEYSWQTGTAMIFNTYRYPIIAKNMRPATQACIPCHDPARFSGDKLVTLKNYATDEQNTLTTTYMILKTGGGTRQQGLGKGIHWHIENPVYYLATDAAQQNIPLVRVVNQDGSVTDYVDTETLVDPKTVDTSKLQRMDCITCHNRVSHNILDPEEAVNDLIGRGLVSPTIPYIAKEATAVLSANYASMDEANLAITGIATYYQQFYADFFTKNAVTVSNAIEALRSYYQSSKFFDQKMDWTTHPNNVGHDDSAGCFRCHDGKHVAATGEAIRLECNLCHSIPVLASAKALTTDIQVSTGVEPASHNNTNWITLHNQAFDYTCAGCHTVGDPGGTSNTSFCSNSECHGQPWTYAGFNAPNLRQVLQAQLPKVLNPTPTPKPTLSPAQATQTAAALPSAKLTYADVAPLFKQCTSCHTAGGSAGLDLSSYSGIMAGSRNGPVIVPGDPASSKLVVIQSGSHYVQFSADELAQVVQWIKIGAPEK
ncbi:MAG TPA: NapC/NirT family cytochrome c [Anaerolineaceae bacterium]|nr:NapC/NirT family cytochrome c [Anaerolineaceae bacterium]